MLFVLHTQSFVYCCGEIASSFLIHQLFVPLLNIDTFSQALCKMNLVMV